jgi:hypothetical protein
LEEEDEEEDDVIEAHSTESDFCNELISLVDENAEVKDENGDFGESGGGEVEDHACPADL